MELTSEEIRVLGVLLEKAATTPDHYPLSTNALTTACNQKSSRDPVVDYDQHTVLETMLLLRPAGLARTIISGRTEKHRHVVGEAWGLDEAELAVLAVLMLRGPQSVGELRTRTERSHGFASTDAVEEVLRRLGAGEEPFVRNVGRAPGQSQDRWTHLLGAATDRAEPKPAEPETIEPSSLEPTASAEPRGAHTGNSPVDIAALEARVAALEGRMKKLENELGI